MKGRVFTYAGVGKRTVKAATADALKAKTGRSGAWGYEFAAIDPATGKRRSVSAGGMATKREAQAALAARIVEVGDRPASVVRRVDGSMTVRDFVTAEYLPSLRAENLADNLKETSMSAYRSIVEAYVVARIGGLRVRDVTPRTLSNLYVELRTRGGRGGRPLAAATVHHVHVNALRLFELASRRGLIKDNPAAKIDDRERPKAGKRNPDRIQHWTAEEARRFLAVADEHRLAVLYEVALNLGLRRGELCGLQWRDVDLDGARLTVRRNRVVIGAYEVVETTPKTAKGERQIELDGSVVRMLGAHRHRQREERLAWGVAWAGAADEPSRYVFSAEDGSPLHPQFVNRLTKRLTKRAQVPYIGVHGLRHTSATMALAGGVPLKVVSERLGHSSVDVTADLYMHVVAGMQRSASEAISRQLGRS